MPKNEALKINYKKKLKQLPKYGKR